jgi:hypothetical protein
MDLQRLKKNHLNILKIKAKNGTNFLFTRYNKKLN